MKISNANTQISFSKQLVAQCCVLNNKGEQEPCSIYQLEKNIDKDYIVKSNNFFDWAGSNYLYLLSMALQPDSKIRLGDVYAIETKNSDFLGFCQIFDDEIKNQDELFIGFLETVPTATQKPRKFNQKYKYVGETMLAFLTKIAQKENKSSITASPILEAKKFYTRKCFFDKKSFYGVSLPSKNFNKLCEQNKSHTNSDIEILV